ncbi:SprT-like family protein [Chitinophaga polysaccharea]|uniref:SprT-like family protein n=1 Tax=Chitinophaga polysaccharea TaxID=1293035 RepID=A0A561P0R6_9BACT|nr:SprT-like domain-containing protein [Chitinophaga polysaccharea]TWF31708.1 SprT-like family protein [Chitinophaga polysaccharea]
MAITHYQFNTLENLFYYYNIELFDASLPDCLVNMSRHRGAHGFFAPDSWKDDKDKIIHEISLNPDSMTRPDHLWHSTFVHEMCHLWQFALGRPPRKAYHDLQWAAKMEEVGLMPSSTGQPGGKKIGQSVTHYIIDGGPFDISFKKITADQLATLKLPYLPNYQINVAPTTSGIDRTLAKTQTGFIAPVTKGKNGVKSVYTCSCGVKVWGKPALQIKCGVCDDLLNER